jgi:pre-mRNA-splicing helicase BRR2
MSEAEKSYVKGLYGQGIVRLLIVIYAMSWAIDDLESHLVIVMDAERYDAHQHRAVEYSIPDMLQIMGRANNTTATHAAAS